MEIEDRGDALSSSGSIPRSWTDDIGIHRNEPARQPLSVVRVESNVFVRHLALERVLVLGRVLRAIISS